MPAKRVPLSQLLYRRTAPPPPKQVSSDDAQLEQRLLRTLVAACVVACQEDEQESERLVAAVNEVDWDGLLQLVVHLLNAPLLAPQEANDFGPVKRLYAATVRSDVSEKTQLSLRAVHQILDDFKDLERRSHGSAGLDSDAMVAPAAAGIAGSLEAFPTVARMCGMLLSVCCALPADRGKLRDYVLLSSVLKPAAASSAPTRPSPPDLLTSWETFVQKACGWGLHRRVVSHMNPNASHIRRIMQQVRKCNPGFSHEDEERLTVASMKLFEAVALMRHTLENLRNSYRRLVQMTKVLSAPTGITSDGAPDLPPSMEEPLRRCIKSYHRAAPLAQYRRVFDQCTESVDSDLREAMLGTLETEVRRLCDTINSEGDRLIKIYSCIDAALRTGGEEATSKLK